MACPVRYLSLIAVLSIAAKNGKPHWLWVLGIITNRSPR
jgi:hypothetical protein